MSPVRRLAASVLLVVATLCLAPGLVTPDAYDEQFREELDAPPSARFPLGTDALGRNRLSRILHGARTSLLLAPLASLVSVVLAAATGIAAAASGGAVNRLFEFVLDLMGSLPWLFVLIAVRAALPLDAGPVLITAVTFGLLALLGWAAPARVIRNVVTQIRTQEFVRQAEALGIRRHRLWIVQLLPNVMPVALAQVWVNLPLFILSEANLGLLGLGVSEPVPSLGTQMRELESLSGLTSKPWLLAPVVLLAVVVSCLWLIGTSREERAS